MAAGWGGSVCYPAMGVLDKDTPYWFDALSNQIVTQNTPGVCKINVVFEPIEVVIHTVDPEGAHLTGGMLGAAWLIGGSYDWVSTPHSLTLANGGGASYLAVGCLGVVCYPGMSAVNKDTTYLYDAITGQISVQSSLGVNKIAVVVDPAVFNVPESPFGTVGALVSSLIALVSYCMIKRNQK